MKPPWDFQQRSQRAASSKPPACYFPFIANGVSFSACTMEGQTRSYWCSTTENYDRDGNWSWCTGPGTSSYLACVFPFLYNGVQQTQCVLDIKGYTWCSSTANYDRDGKAIYCLEVDFKLSTATISSGTLGPGILAETSPVATESDTLATADLDTTTASPGTTLSETHQDVSKSTSPALKTSPTTAQTTLQGSSLRPIPSTSQDWGSTDSQSTGGSSGMTLATTNSAQPTGSTGSSSYNSSDKRQLMEWLNHTTTNMSTEMGLGIIPDLQTYVTSIGPSGFQKNEEELIVYILGNITENIAQSNLSFPSGAVMDILYIVNEILNETSWKQASTMLSPTLLRCFENLLESMELVNASYNVSYENIEFHCLVAPCVNMSNENALSINPHISLALAQEDSQQTFHPACLVNILLLSFATLNMDFPGQYEAEEQSIYQVDSNIITNVLRVHDKTFHNPNINLTFQCSNGNYCDPTTICAFWNFTKSIWSSEGCTTEIEDGETHCYCHHLTSFSVLIAKYIPSALKNNSALDYITMAGLVISILSLVLCITFQVYLLKFPMNLVAYYRHTAILNASIFLLLSYISFIAASYITPKQYLRLCVGLTFCTHFSLLAFFCWTLVQSLFLFCRLVFVFHHITKKEFMSVSIGLGYVCPSLIAVGTFLYYSPTNDYRRDNVCWLDTDSGASMAFNIPTIIILSGNFLVLLVVIRKLLRPSISEGCNEDEEVIKKLVKAVVFCTPQFGLTWAIGIPLLSDGSCVALHYLFCILNPLQGFFIFIFGCLLDKKVMDMIKKRMSKTPIFSSMATTVSSY
ncbi:adhesion G-protein coupled receptor F1-like [Dendrobates tinctorius]|uniref:adhesion G-protein coupled receptor F1-like n=1 Tax=Dendrobates tinctorius TaxID=92724 RepID=UPI003CC9F266